MYPFPAERSGLAIFYNELLIRRSNILDSFVRENRDEEILKDMVSRYSKPINDYINFLSQMPRVTERQTRKNNKFIQYASLRFVAKDEMEKAGYGYLLPYLNK